MLIKTLFFRFGPDISKIDKKLNIWTKEHREKMQEINLKKEIGETDIHIYFEYSSRISNICGKCGL